MMTKKSRRDYFKSLRRSWKVSKDLAENDEKAKALFRESGFKGVSYYSFYFVKLSMDALGYDGLPYIDCKTYRGWIESGFRVKKGEKSKIKGLVWLNPRDKDGEVVDDVVYPKQYNLFHKSQVLAIK